MSKRGTESWLLYVDESGGFASSDESNIVVGLLVRGEESPSVDAALRRELEQIFPLSPWPPHASVLNSPASRVFFALQGAGAPGPRRDRALREVQPAVDIVVASDAQAARAFVENARRGAKPDYAALQVIGELVRRQSREAFARLRALADEEREAWKAFLRETSAKVDPSNLILVGGVARQVDPPTGLSEGELEVDSYVQALEALLERAVCAIREDSRHPSTDVVIWARVATRHVGVLGYGRRLELNASHIAKTARRASSVAKLKGSAEVRVRSLEHVTRYDSAVHPGVVLADLMANAMFHLLEPRTRANTTWSAIEHLTRQGVGLPVARASRLVNGGALPTIAVAGVARQAVAAAFSGSTAVPLETESALWARQQAAMWIEAAARGREGTG